MYCFWVQHTILGANYLKKNLLVNQASLRTKTNSSLVLNYYMKPLHLWGGDEIFEKNFQFKWKQPVTKMSSDWFFSQNLLTKSLSNIFHVSAVSCYCQFNYSRYSRYVDSLLFFSKLISRTAIPTQALVITYK